MAASSAAQQVKHRKLPGYCSICWCGDGKEGMHLQDCSECGVLFHNECYQRDWSLEYDPTVRCWACMAVGTTVKGRALDGSRHDVSVKERPTECALCTVNMRDIPLAMHALYDDHGTKGRQIMLKSRSTDNIQYQPAWCHTLCALFICSYSRTAGCVYGCTASGTYMGDDDVEVENDERSVNFELTQALQETPEEHDVGVHHFVVVLPTWRGENQWTKAIRASKKLPPCYICHKIDDRPDIVRFPVQCSANEPEEYAGKKLHKDKDICTSVVHVGCAIWHRGPTGNWPMYRQVYFYPGRPSHKTRLVADIYCFQHAKDLAPLESSSFRRFPEPNEKFNQMNKKKITQGVASSGTKQTLPEEVTSRGDDTKQTKTRSVGSSSASGKVVASKEKVVASNESSATAPTFQAYRIPKARPPASNVSVSGFVSTRATVADKQAGSQLQAPVKSTSSKESSRQNAVVNKPAVATAASPHTLDPLQILRAAAGPVRGQISETSDGVEKRSHAPVPKSIALDPNTKTTSSQSNILPSAAADTNQSVVAPAKLTSETGTGVEKKSLAPVAKAIALDLNAKATSSQSNTLPMAAAAAADRAGVEKRSLVPESNSIALDPNAKAASIHSRILSLAAAVAAATGPDQSVMDITTAVGTSGRDAGAEKRSLVPEPNFIALDPNAEATSMQSNILSLAAAVAAAESNQPVMESTTAVLANETGTGVEKRSQAPALKPMVLNANSKATGSLIASLPAAVDSNQSDMEIATPVLPSGTGTGVEQQSLAPVSKSIALYSNAKATSSQSKTLPSAAATGSDQSHVKITAAHVNDRLKQPAAAASPNYKAGGDSEPVSMPTTDNSSLLELDEPASFAASEIDGSDHETSDNTDLEDELVNNPPKKRYKRSSLIMRMEPNSTGQLVVRMGSPVQAPVKKDWSKLFVGPNYDPDMAVWTTWDSIDEVDPKDIEEDME
ncbi:hypothetical protein MPSEU_000108900 [Mayamaea pseudoterrestris]|nr:hypothetical protein MPSEU_000108900 [Mayamaea pseudoterrestris]